jgi:peptidyl-tRNA hydrolase, PTH1 family
MRVIAGLGNPGKAYQKTRHNLGFLVLDALARDLDVKIADKEFGALTGSWRSGQQKTLLVKPQEFMNRSGESLSRILHYHKLATSDLLVVVDDFNLDLGILRLKPGGSAGGHNGLQSIIDNLGTSAFSRLRIGIGSPQKEAADYVLANFSKAEKDQLDEAVNRAATALKFFLRHGLEKTMNEFNT